MTRDAGVLRERRQPRAGRRRARRRCRLRPRGAEPPDREPRARARGVGASGVARAPTPAPTTPSRRPRSSAASCSRATTIPTSCRCSACRSPRREHVRRRRSTSRRRRRRAPSPRISARSATSPRRCSRPTHAPTADVVARAAACSRAPRCATEVFAQLDAAVELDWLRRRRRDRRPRYQARPCQRPAPRVLTGERTALNFLCHLRASPRSTRRFVEAAGDAARRAGTPARRCPGCARWRRPRCGGRRRQPPGLAVGLRAREGQPPRGHDDHRRGAARARAVAGPHGRGRVRSHRPG